MGKNSEILKQLKKLEEYLLECDIVNIEILYISDDYYSIGYYKDDKAYIKQFTTEEVEMNN